MEKIKLTKLNIKNFRNINELEINFNENVTEIFGENGTGKTNTLSSIMWCLFGKDINDNKQFPISPIIDGVEDNTINTVVKLVINGEYVIERSYCKRITNLKTGWVIDGKEELVAISQSKYNEELKEHLVDEETFKSLSNINYIPNLHWKDLKSLILGLVGNVSDNEVLLNGDFTNIEEYVNKFGIEQTKELITKTDKELKQDIKRLETEYQTLMNTKEKYVIEEENVESLKIRKEEIEKEIANIKEHNQKIDEQRRKVQNDNKIAQERMSNIKNKNLQIENLNNQIKEYEELYKANSFDENTQRENDKQATINEIKNMQLHLTNEKEQLKSYEVDLEELKTKGKLEKEREIKVENNMCSTCGQDLPEHLINQTLEKLKQEQLKNLETYKQKVELTIETINTLKNNIANTEEDIKKLNIALKEIETKVYENIETTPKQKEIQEVIDSKKYELNQLNIKLSELKEIEIPLPDLNEFEEYQEIDLTEYNQIQEQLATTITLGKISEDINKIVEELDTKKENLIKNSDKTQSIIKFINTKAQLLKNKLKVHFTTLDFQISETTLEGIEKECFYLIDEKGIQYKELNTAKKITLAIDLLVGIMKLKDLYLPLLVDNIESVTKELETKETQLIIARAIKNNGKLEVK